MNETFSGYPNQWPEGLYAGIGEGSVKMVLVKAGQPVMKMNRYNDKWGLWPGWEYHSVYVRIGDA